MRHALYEGMYDHLAGLPMWQFEAAMYGPSHLCYGTPEHGVAVDRTSGAIYVLDYYNCRV